MIVALFFVTALMFELSIGFITALPEISDHETMGRVSAWDSRSAISAARWRSGPCW